MFGLLGILDLQTFFIFHCNDFKKNTPSPSQEGNLAKYTILIASPVRA
ncbi:MAG: hypothetical protein RL699_2007 [Bacteroidota bacterium]|jgi:hypothetical protein